MPALTAILHTHNDALRIGRALESLRVCESLIVVDHDSQDTTRAIAREYGALLLGESADPTTWLATSPNDWILCLLTTEVLHENLEASLLEWKASPPGDVPGYRISVREQTPAGWTSLGRLVRLVHRARVPWSGALPSDNLPSAAQMEGDILRFPRP